MELVQWFDPGLKALAALSGLGLAGMMVVRTTPRGKWKIIGFEPEPLFDPRTVHVARMLAWAFGIFLVMLLARQS